MKISQQQLKQIIKEELSKALAETDAPQGADMVKHELEQACQKCRQGRAKAKQQAVVARYERTKCRNDRQCENLARKLRIAGDIHNCNPTTRTCEAGGV
tara:strand:+ start:647 stop:943 length:297 start_codon:yes stop_codon:yes gene_type:complete